MEAPTILQNQIVTWQYPSGREIRGRVLETFTDQQRTHFTVLWGNAFIGRYMLEALPPELRLTVRKAA